MKASSIHKYLTFWKDDNSSTFDLSQLQYACKFIAFLYEYQKFKSGVIIVFTVFLDKHRTD